MVDDALAFDIIKTARLVEIEAAVNLNDLARNKLRSIGSEKAGDTCDVVRFGKPSKWRKFDCLGLDCRWPRSRHSV
jgi:hypothetical protein